MNDLTMFNILERHALQQPNATAYVFLDTEGISTTLSYSGLLHRVRAIAAQLQKCHMAGDRILLMYQPGLDFIAAILACFAAGMVAVPVQPIQNRRVLSRLVGIMENSGCSKLLTNSSTKQTLLRAIPDIETATTGLSWLCTDNEGVATQFDFRKPIIDPSSTAFLQYTSGSTGAPKGVIVSHRNLLNNESLIKSAFGHDSSTIFAGWLPLYHDMGLIGNVFQPLYLGIPSVLFAPMTFLASPIVWLRTISKWRATTSGAPSFAYELCVNRIADADMDGVDLSSWQIAYNGAEPVKAKVMDSFVRKFAPYGFREEAFYPCYGMAEATLFISGGNPATKARVFRADPKKLECNIVQEDPNGTQLVSCGSAHTGHDIVIVDPERLCKLADGQVGEIWSSGPSMATGYWGKPELSEATFQAKMIDGAGPYLRTGDLGFCHDGELYVTGRLKDLIIVRGQNHYPHDIEATVYDGHEALKAGGAAAFVVENEDDFQLIVVAEVERHSLAKLSEDALQSIFAKARKDVSDKHGLRVTELMLIKPSTLPKTSSGKIRRNHCRDLYCQNKLDRVVLRPQIHDGFKNDVTELA